MPSCASRQRRVSRSVRPTLLLQVHLLPCTIADMLDRRCEYPWTEYARKREAKAEERRAAMEAQRREQEAHRQAIAEKMELTHAASQQHGDARLQADIAAREQAEHYRLAAKAECHRQEWAAIDRCSRSCCTVLCK